MFRVPALIRRFEKSEDGAVALIFGLTAPVLMVLMGLALDGSRAYTMARQAGAALDTAALAAAKQMTLGERSQGQLKKYAKEYFEQNFKAMNAAADVKVTEFDLKSNARTGTVVASVRTSLPTTFTRLIGIKDLSARRESTVTYNVNDIEIGLMLDVTGSMSGGKIDSLKNSVKLLADTLMNDNTGTGTVKIGLAPYSSSVNLGDRADAISNNTSTDNCVVTRLTNETNDKAPTDEDTYYRSIETARQDLRDATGNAAADYTQYRCPDAVVLPLTSDKDVIKTTVDGYSTGGYTSGHIGIQWAWNLVAEGWGDTWGGGEAAPKDYNTEKNIKAVILMTDGKFNTDYANSTSFAQQTEDSYAKSQQLCDAMKDPKANVLVFSIGFQLDDTDAENNLRDCASQNPDTNKKYFYSADNEDELKKAYLDIAIKLQNLRVAR